MSVYYERALRLCRAMHASFVVQREWTSIRRLVETRRVRGAEPDCYFSGHVARR